VDGSNHPAKLSDLKDLVNLSKELHRAEKTLNNLKEKSTDKQVPRKQKADAEQKFLAKCESLSEKLCEAFAGISRLDLHTLLSTNSKSSNLQK